jgi:5-methylcytosine-specific restriction enzyme A
MNTRNKKGGGIVPKNRPPQEVWFQNIRPIVWERDNKKCTRCGKSVTLKECHIDHIQSGKLGSNKLKNLRTLCKVCHVLRADHRHHGMIAKALKEGIIPTNWRDYVWEEN